MALQHICPITSPKKPSRDRFQPRFKLQRTLNHKLAEKTYLQHEAFNLYVLIVIVFLKNKKEKGNDFLVCYLMGVF
jgi:hypothetical protein